MKETKDFIVFLLNMLKIKVKVFFQFRTKFKK